MKNKLSRIYFTFLLLLTNFNVFATDLDDAKSIYDAGYNQQISGKLENSISHYDELIKRFGSSRNAEVQVKVAYALIQKSLVLLNKNELDAALSCEKEIISRFENSQDIRLNNLVSSAIGGIGVILYSQNKLDDAIIYLDMSISKNRETIKLLNKSIEASSPPILLHTTPDYQISFNLVLKGKIYSEQKKHVLAISSFDDVIKEFSASPDLNVHDVVKLAKTLKEQELEIKAVI